MNKKTGLSIEAYIQQEITKHIGAIEALSAMLRNIERPGESVNEQEQKKEREAGAEDGAIDPAATGNGYSHTEAGAAETESEANG